MSRLRVFQIQLAASAAVLLLAFSIVRTLWYPGAYFDISGAGKQFWLLVAVVLVVGPVLTTLVYRPGKKGLVMDLWILGGIQLAAIIAAMTVLYQRQPYFTVFAVDRFEAVTRDEVTDFDLARQTFGSRHLQEPRLIFASLPEDPERMSTLIDETVFMGMADIDRRPEFWEPYVSGVTEVKSVARPLRELNVDAEQLAAITDRLEVDADGLTFLPLRGKVGDATMLVDAETGYPVASVNLDPWSSATQDGPPAGDVEQAH